MKKHSFFRSFLLPVLLIFLVVGSLLAAGLGYVFARGGPARMVEQALIEALPGLTVEIGRLDWAFHADMSPISVELEDSRLGYAGQQLSLPLAEMRFGISSLISGLPEQLIIKGLMLDLHRDEAGWGLTETGSGDDWLLPLAGADLGELAARQQIGLRLLEIQADSLVVTDSAGPEPTRLEFVNSRFRLDAGNPADISGSVRLAQPEGGRLSVLLSGNLLSGFWQADVTMRNFHPGGLPELAPVWMQQWMPAIQAKSLAGDMLFNFDGTRLEIASGRADLTDISPISPARQIAEQDAARQSAAGLSHIDWAGFLPASWTAFDQLGFDFVWSRADDVLRISEAAAVLDGGQKITLSGQASGFAGPRTVLSGSLLAEDLAFADILSVWPDSARPEGLDKFEQAVDAGRFTTLLVQTEASLDQARSRLDIAQLALKGDFEAARLRISHGQVRSLVGTLSGALDIKLGPAGQIDLLQLDARLAQGYLSAAGLDRAIALKSAEMQLGWYPDRLDITGLAVDFGADGTAGMEASLQLASGQPGLLNARIESPDIEADMLKALWPEPFGRRTASWVKSRFAGGRISAAQLDIIYDPGADAGRRIKDMSGQLRWQGAGFRWADASPQITDTDFEIMIADNRLQVDIHSGQLPGLSLRSGQVELLPVLGEPRLARQIMMHGSASGAVQSARKLLTDPTLGQLPAGLAALDLGSGLITADVTATGELAGGRLSIKNLASESNLSGLSVGGLPLGLDLANADLVVSQQGQQITATGNGLLSGLSSSFSVTSPDGRQAALQLVLAPDPGVTDILQRYSNIAATGKTGLKLALGLPNEAGARDLQLDLALDEAGIDVPEINWAKLPGEAGRASLRLRLANGRIEAADEIDLALGSLSAGGRLVFDAGGGVQAGYFERLRLPGQDVDMLLLERMQDGTIQINAEGRQVDLTSLRQGEGLSRGQALFLDITAGRILVEKDISLSGHLTGQTDRAGNGSVELQGALLAAGKPLLSEASITARFGPSGESLSGVGLIGGGEAELRYQPAADGRPGQMEINTRNAGRVLKGLGVTDAIRGGRMRLVNSFPGKDFGQFDTQIDILDFRVIEAPAAVRAFSVLSLAGLYSLVEGDGTGFARGEAKFSTKDGFHRLETIRASGAALGIAMVGSYNRNSGEVDVSGNLVPVNQLSELIGKVPVLGEIFTGIDKSGLFATQFTYKGPVSDPQVEVNAVSLVTPGLLRDLFSPDWLGSEAERILGPAASTRQP